MGLFDQEEYCNICGNKIRHGSQDGLCPRCRSKLDNELPYRGYY